MQDQELFQHYELKNWNFSPRIYKIIGASAIVNILMFVMLTQANFLTSRSCDTPIVSGVCSVLDALYVGSVMADNDMGFVSEDYQKTQLDDADITYIDLTGQTPPLEYPEGYFAVSNPEQQTEVATIEGYNPTTPGTYIPGITGNTNPTLNNGTTNLTVTPQITPTPNKRTVTGNLPTGVTTDSSTTVNNRDRRDTTNPTTTETSTTATTTEQNQPVQSEPVREVGKINRKPFELLGDGLNKKLVNQQVDLNKNFLVIMDGTILADGRLDKKNSKYVRLDGDPQMIIVAKDAIEAFGDSGLLYYLKINGIDKANLTLKQDDTQIDIMLVSDQKDANKANTTASGFAAMISGLIVADKNGLAKLDENTKLLINNAKVTSDGKNFVLRVTIPKADAQAMIIKSLKDRAEKKAKETNSNVETSNNINPTTTK